MVSRIKKPYEIFGKQIALLRVGAGIDTQDELAKLLGRSQQTVSRWEAGTARPKPDDVVSLASLLNANSDELLADAGYKPTPSTAGIITFDKQLPLENLPPDTFERFLRTVLEETFPSRVVKRFGESGHKQDGIDLISTDNDGRIDTYQCKRVHQFGPANVKKVIAAHSVKADRNYIVLSRVASPQATDEIRKYSNWEILDKEDLSSMVRRLSHEAQNRIVDIYFPGKRFELFGRHPAGPWLTLLNFFQPFEAREAAFSHGWALKGRDAEIGKIADALATSDSQAVIVTAPGGFGKTRLLKESIGQYQAKHPDVLVRFLSNTASPSATDLDALGYGLKLIIVDDAHDRDDLAPLFEFAALPSNRTRIVLASRPYGAERIKRQAATFGLSSQIEIPIWPLSNSDLLAMALDVLGEFGAAESWAPVVVDVGGQSPLITAMAARVVAREAIPAAMATAKSELKTFVLGKFQKVVMGELGLPGDQQAIAQLLNLLAIIQPFDTQEPEFDALVARVTGLDDVTCARLIKLLADGGVIFKRGRYFRLMPDVLGDYLIDQSCIDVNDRLTPLALKIFQEAQGRITGRVLQNLGRLDWRRSEGDPSASTLLEHVWKNLDDISDPWDPRLKAVRDVASYQPAQALEFIQKQLTKGKHLREFAEILRQIAFSERHFNEAAELLWLLGREDSGNLGSNSDHPIRLLSELVAVEENKPFSITVRAFDFGMDLFNRTDAWTGIYTPFDVVDSILRGVGETTEYNERDVTIKPFLILYGVVEPLRKRLLDRIFELLVGGDARAANKAASTLGNALRWPTPAFGGAVSSEVRKSYESEFSRTLTKILSLVKSNKMQPSAMIVVGKSISWHANYGCEPLSSLAKEIREAMPKDLRFRTWVALADGFGHDFMGPWNAETWDTEISAWIGSLVTDLRQAFNDPEKLHEFLEQILSEMNEVRLFGNASIVLIQAILRTDLAFARTIVEEAFKNPGAMTTRFLGSAVTEIVSSDPHNGRALIRRLLSSDQRSLRVAGSTGFTGLRRDPEEADFVLLSTMVSDLDWQVSSGAVRSIWSWDDADPMKILSVVRQVHIGDSSEVAEALCMLLSGTQKRLLAHMRNDDFHTMLDKLVNVPKLENFQIDEFLAYASENFAVETADFFFRRVERYSKEKWFNESRPVNHGPWNKVPLRFRNSPDAAVVFERAWKWFKQYEKSGFYLTHNAAHLVEAIFQEFDTPVVDMLNRKLSSATGSDLQLITLLLRNASPQFVFKNREFVSHFLDRCASFGDDTLDDAISSLWASANSGVRRGIVGESFPEDFEMEKSAEEAMGEVSRLSPTYRLFAAIRDHARSNIKRQRIDNEALGE